MIRLSRLPPSRKGLGPAPGNGQRIRSTNRIHHYVCCGLLLAAALAAGCKKQTSASGSTAPTPDPARPAMGAAAATTVPDTGDASAALAQLSLELRKYVVRTRSVPKNFEEFAAKSGVRAPTPPAGKKYAIQDQAVVLVKR
jgi:hypothetical protein